MTQEQIIENKQSALLTLTSASQAPEFMIVLVN
jgi:hypothetical protein